MDSAPFRLPTAWPLPADPEAAERLVGQFAELGATEARLAKGRARAMLRALGGNSPFLSGLALRESATIRRFAAKGPEAVIERAMAALASIPPQAPRPRVASALREAKRIVALASALADIGGIWPLNQVVAAISGVAEACLRLAVAHLLRAGHDSGELRLPDPANPALGCGFTVLGMGKLGAGELNYSSDVDLILLQDPDSGVYHGDSPGAFYTRLARGLVALMEARDADGYVFRTDLRLRPDPAATPPCIALPAAIAYYESMGQNWERAAMLKARPVAGDLALGAVFLEAIRPFVWRRHLDFAAMADIHAMKRLIDAHKGTDLGQQRDPVGRILGHNVKLGQGGIREIEFLAQTQQLVWGGRDPGLRVRPTLEALQLLVAAGHLPQRTARELAGAYRFLRQVEHRLQMVDDRQVHTLPETAEALERFALFMGYQDGAAFARALLAELGRVQRRYREVFETVPAPPDAQPVSMLDFRGPNEASPQTAQTLTGMGYENPAAIVAGVRGWQAGRIRALRSQRARELLDAMLPTLLATLGRQPQPDAAFARFDAFLTLLPAGVQLLSLFQRNPTLLDRVAAVLGAAPQLADYLTRMPHALEGLLAPHARPDFPALLKARTADSRSLEDAIGQVRGVVREEDFAVAVATLQGEMDANEAGLARTALADAVLAALLPRVLADFSQRHGRVTGGAMAVVLLGKAGGREMMAGSDLDLMLIYDHPEHVHESAGTPSKGARRFPASQWFIRAVHAYVAAVTAPDAYGPMFPVDMRLRPSGNKGPVAVSLSAFRRYHEADAWTWERMALTRARVVAGPAKLRAAIEAAIRVAVTHAGEPARIRQDALSMRARLLRELPASGPWDVKPRAGGQIEVEFVAQSLQLVHGSDHPEILNPTTRIALSQLAKAGFLPPGDADLLIRADLVWRSVQGLLRIAYGRAPRDAPSDATAATLVRAARAAGLEVVDLPGLSASLDDIARQVRDVFNRHLGEIAT